MAQTMYYSTTLVIESCCQCGIHFAMPANFRAECLKFKVGKTFYCPNGHPQHFSGPTEAQQERAARLAVEARLDQQRATTAAVRRQLSATKGVVTRTKKRIGNGVCPCCNRHFTNVERHMTTQHPDYAEV